MRRPPGRLSSSSPHPRLLLFLFSCFVLATQYVAIANVDPASKPRCWESACSVPKNSLRFFLIGDTGGFPIYPYNTMAQKKTAKAMANLADSQPIDFVLNVGDNVYFNGVTDVNSPRFKASFEEPYSAASLQKNWYMIAGNHDHFGNVDAEVAYTVKSNKWVFPNLYYKVGYVLDDKTTVDVIAIDTIQLCGNTKDIQDAGFLKMLFTVSHTPQGPTDPAAAESQWKWIESQLAASTADYLLVMGHYPMYSLSSHGPTECLKERLRPMLHRYAVNGFFSGHDHALQLFEEAVQNATWGKDHTIHYIVSGAASRTDRSQDNIDKVPQASFHYPTGWNPFSNLGFSKGGFIFVNLDKSTAVFEFYGGSGELKHTSRMIPRSDKQKPTTG